MKTLPDNELNTELQELYLTGKQWLSDVEFLSIEQCFLHSLLNQPNFFSIPNAASRFADDLVRTEGEERQLYLHILGFMNQLELLICQATINLEMQLIEDFSLLQTEVADALGHLKALKYRMIEQKNIN
ncbi:hypothetical protein ABDD95_20830 [Mucilaginibacter sp. PAMB04274]|uniref:hypothetical protein n=1 Tax=Mucilaginibacter sp. PAMB04274 TaxID=3138568 RepID=UPI0031F6867A